MKLVVLYGPPAVGKMTVGKAIAKLTDYKLFYNHMSIELVLPFFDFGTPEFERLNDGIRFQLFKEIAASEAKGLIFTIVLALNLEEDLEYMEEVEAIFTEKGWSVHYVELKADLDVRLQRNRHEDRLAAKFSKRDLERSENSLKQYEVDYRMHTNAGELPGKDILKIDNSNLSPEEVAIQVKKHFSL